MKSDAGCVLRETYPAPLTRYASRITKRSRYNFVESTLFVFQESL